MGYNASERLLLVEHDEVIVKKEIINLKKYGYEVVSACNAGEAVEIIKESDIALVILDVSTDQEENAADIARRLLKVYDGPLLFRLNSFSDAVLKETEKVPVHGYLEKGMNPAVVDVSIKTVLRQFRSRKQDKVEMELEKTRTMLYDVINTIPFRVFWKNLDSVYMGCNLLFALDSGRKSPEEIIGTTDYDIRDEVQAESNRKDDKNIITSGKPRINYEEPFYTQGGEKTWIMTSKIPLYNNNGTMYGILGMYEDITKRKKIEEELLRQKNRLSNILYGSNVGTWEWNPQTGENIVNEYWASAIGYRIDEVPVNMPDFWKLYVHPEDMAVVNELLEKLFNKESGYFEYEFRMRHKNGNWVWILSRGKVSVWDGDKPVLVSGTHMDITERKAAREEIMHQLLEKEMILKEVHHRIKNNFASVCSLLSLQSNTAENREVKIALRDATGRIRSMQVLYEKLLLAGNYRNAPINSYLNDLVDNIAEIFSGGINIRIEKQFCDCRLTTKQMFPLGIIINELITNSMKYAFEGRDSGVIRVVLEEREGRVELVIHDDGIGLPQDFDISSNNGFGLMLVKIFSQQLKGLFTINNSEGTKSSLVFEIS